MQQGLLFEPQTLAQAELRQAIERLDFAAASLKLQEFRRIWPASGLAWEPELIRIGSKFARRRLDLDSGYKAFKSGFVPAPGELCGPRRFCLHWIISENKAFCSDSELIDARIQMKALNSRLHARYMQCLA